MLISGSPFSLRNMGIYVYQLILFGSDGEISISGSPSGFGFLMGSFDLIPLLWVLYIYI